MRGLVLLLVLPLAAAAPMLEDPPGDLRMEVYETYSTAQPGDWEGLDLLSVNISETPEDLFITVGLVGLPDCTGGACADGPDIRTHFRYGDVGYYTNQGVTFDGFGIGRLNEVVEGQTNGRVLATGLENILDAEEGTMTLRVPRALIVDESGNPLLRGREITDIWVNTYGQFNFGGPSPDLRSDQDLFVQRDDMGIDAPAKLTLEHGGFDGNGAFEIAVDSPFRASNGGAAVYAYQIQIAHGGGERTASVLVRDVPSGWTVQAPAHVSLPAGGSASIPIYVETPSGHRHGGTDKVVVRIEAGDDWASAEVGVHYLDVPQPAGHHPDLHIHARTLGAFGTFSEAFGGSAGDLWMNTLEEDADDEGADVQGYNGAAGVMWTACLRPDLRLGLDLNSSREGWMAIGLRSDLPRDISLAGRLLRLGPGEPILGCYDGRWEDRDVQEIATLSADPVSVAAGASAAVRMAVAPTPAGDYVPFEHGATLVLELTASVDATLGPSRLFLQPGARLHLPIDEYRDERPPGFVDGSTQVVQADAIPTETTSAAAKESPLAMQIALLGLAGGALASRRR